MFARKHTKKRMDRARSQHRTDIKLPDWDKCMYAQSDICERLLELNSEASGFTPVKIVNAKDLGPAEFFSKYAAKSKPVIIRGAIDSWPAVNDQRWEIPQLHRRFKHNVFKVGEDDEGRKLRVKMKTFLDYMENQVDDSPLYLFECGMDGHTRSLRKDYRIPEYFPNDFLNLVGKQNKPPHRWFCIGPKRSGTTVHRDPIGTAAWNAVTHGIKRWVLFEPHEDRSLVKGRKYKQKGEDDEAIHYFDYILPRVREANPHLKVYECVQMPGDVIFVPGQWWHGVLNLSDTVAVTHNYCGWDNIDDVYKRVSRQRRLFCKRWVRNMRKFSPVLYKYIAKLRTNPTMGKYVDCVSSSSSSSSSDSSDYSSSESEDDIEWFGVPTSE
jgi:histone arginine demethylase JMJD6